MPFLFFHVLLAFCLDLAHTLRHSDRDLALEVLLLRQQLRLYARRTKRSRTSRREKAPLGGLTARLPDLARVALVFTPATLLRWHREAVRRKWTFANAPRAGRPATSATCVELVLRLARENPNPRPRR